MLAQAAPAQVKPPQQPAASNISRWNVIDGAIDILLKKGIAETGDKKLRVEYP